MDCLIVAQEGLNASGFQNLIMMAGTGLTAAVIALFTWFKGEHAECKKDRRELITQVTSMQAEFADLREIVGGLQERANGEDEYNTNARKSGIKGQHFRNNDDKKA